MVIVHNHILDLWEKAFRSQLSFSRVGTCRIPQGLSTYRQVPEAKTLF